MSYKKMDRSFPLKLKAISDAELAKIVAIALRQDFGEAPSTIKYIGQLTGTNLRTVKNWYEARNAPSAGHLLLLARSSAQILKFTLRQIGGDDLWNAFTLLSDVTLVTYAQQSSLTSEENSLKENVPINVPLNERQRWFLLSLKKETNLSAKDIAKHFSVTIKTARRDINGLKTMHKISFIGSKRTGRYVL